MIGGGIPGGRRRGLAASFAAAAVLLLFAPWPASSHAFVGCALSGTTLAVFATEDSDRARILRSGDAIHVVAESEYGDGPNILVPCSGAGTPATVHNTDLISIEDDTVAGVRLELSGGTFAPGATPEPDGSSEIEIRATTSEKFEVLTIAGGFGPDRIDAGRTPAGRIGVNLDATEAFPDADLEFIGPGIPFISGGRGADEIRGQGPTGFASPYDTRFVASGGPGADSMWGGTARNLLAGGDGRDRLFGGDRGDLAFPGDGADRVVLGPRKDLVYDQGRGRDRIDCGGGRDVAVVERGDRLKSCRRGTQRNLLRNLHKRDFLFIFLAFDEEDDTG